MRRTGAAAILILVATVAGAGAQGLPPAEDFTFRKVKPPTSGGGPRITVQIDPAEQARRLAALPKAE
ncbi:MAG TPA: lytic transglycosylase domain-containing protein, partial [Paracoccaceae bacterium]|nr:lytic transglycosylase domain-containing protein [Paracoccaceae bacterium]